MDTNVKHLRKYFELATHDPLILIYFPITVLRAVLTQEPSMRGRQSKRLYGCTYVEKTNWSN